MAYNSKKHKKIKSFNNSFYQEQQLKKLSKKITQRQKFWTLQWVSWMDVVFLLLAIIVGIGVFLIVKFKMYQPNADAFLFGSIAMVCYVSGWLICRIKLNYKRAYHFRKTLASFNLAIFNLSRLNQAKRKLNSKYDSVAIFQEKHEAFLNKTRNGFYVTSAISLCGFLGCLINYLIVNY